MNDDFRHAWHLAKRHGLVIATKKERRDPAVPGEYVDVFIVYRNGMRIGKAKSAQRLLALVKSTVKNFSGEAAHAHA